MLVGHRAAQADSPAVTARGVGARASALGNAFVALADDYTATYWNPAGLAFATFREVQVSLEYLPRRTVTRFGGTYDTASRQRVRLGHVGWVRSLPTTRGGIAFALGYSRPYILDNVYTYRGTDTYRGDRPRLGYYYDLTAEGDTVPVVLQPGGKLRFEQSDNTMFGQLGLLTGAVGWQVAPSLGLGFAASLITGQEHQWFETESYLPGADEDTLFQNSTETIDRRYTGVDFRAGLLYTLARRFHFGLRVAAPRIILTRQQYGFRDREYPDYVDLVDSRYYLHSSFSGAVGFAVRLPMLTLSAENSFRSPFPGAQEGSPRSRWKGGAGFGLEAPIPRTPLLVRAGYAWRLLDLHPYTQSLRFGSRELDNQNMSYEPELSDKRDVRRVSGGLALLLKDVLAIEASYVYSVWGATVHSPEWENTIRENHTGHRVLVSFSFRY